MRIVKSASWTLAGALLLATLAIPQTNANRDGNWWRTLQEDFKHMYVTGVFDGMQLGYHLSIWKLSQSNKVEAQCTSMASTSFFEDNNTYFSKVTSGQLSDGLDEFYGDYRNRRIELDGAVWLVANEIAGTPRAKLDKMIEGWRRSAAVPGP